MQIGELEQESFGRSFEAGWWDEQTVDGAECFTPETPMLVSDLLNRELVEKVIPEKLALIHSEVSEALEDYREGKLKVELDERLADEAFLLLLVVIGQNPRIMSEHYDWVYGEELQLALVKRLTSLGNTAEMGPKINRFLFATANRLATTPRPRPKPVGLPTELADIVIRVMDLAGAMGIDMDEVIQQKLEYNKSRPFRHGGKRC